ncbi:hypothetical protein Tco_0324252, partial [Tanacetum coccineum]
SAAHNSVISDYCATTWVRNAITSVHARSLASIDRPQASRDILASISMGLAVRACARLPKQHVNPTGHHLLLSLCIIQPPIYLVCLAVRADKLSPTSYLRLKAKHSLFRGSKQASRTSALRSVEGRSNGGDGVDGAAALIMATDALVRGSTIGDGSGSGWEVDGASALSRIITDLYPKG